MLRDLIQTWCRRPWRSCGWTSISIPEDMIEHMAPNPCVKIFLEIGNTTVPQIQKFTPTWAVWIYLSLIGGFHQFWSLNTNANSAARGLFMLLSWTENYRAQLGQTQLKPAPPESPRGVQPLGMIHPVRWAMWVPSIFFEGSGTTPIWETALNSLTSRKLFIILLQLSYYESLLSDLFMIEIVDLIDCNYFFFLFMNVNSKQWTADIFLSWIKLRTVSFDLSDAFLPLVPSYSWCF